MPAGSRVMVLETHGGGEDEDDDVDDDDDDDLGLDHGEYYVDPG